MIRKAMLSNSILTRERTTMKTPYTYLLVAAIHLLILPTAAFTKPGPACPVFNRYQIYGSCVRADTFSLIDGLDGAPHVQLVCEAEKGSWRFDVIGFDENILATVAFESPRGFTTEIRSEQLGSEQADACQQEIRDAACALYDASDPGDWIGIPNCQN